jgi:2,3-bisphosphoglycerate-independent phosphoglycerate mutase
MDIQELTADLNIDNGSKIVLLVCDGLGGMPREPGGKTELETAATPNLDSLVARNVCGLSIPVLPGITAGSGPGHVALFGYDPLRTTIGRGVLEALGIDFALQPNDVAARGNFCAVDENGVLTDRRAGRIPTETCVRLVNKLRERLDVPGVEVFVEPVREYRFLAVFRGEGLEGAVADTDPQVTGVPPLAPVAHEPGSQRTADVATEFIRQAREILKDDHPANMVMLRGFGRRPAIPTMEEVYGLHPAAIAIYPMYRGLARLVGMTVLPPASNFAEQIDVLRSQWDAFDFFFVHFKYTDSTGEDGKFDEKVRRIEEVDAQIPRILELQPAVFVLTGDHSTPSKLRSHSWHPLPVLLAAATCRPDRVTQFGESDCVYGGLGQFEARYLLPLALAHAGRLQKFGA